MKSSVSQYFLIGCFLKNGELINCFVWVARKRTAYFAKTRRNAYDELNCDLSEVLASHQSTKRQRSDLAADKVAFSSK
jgi:hypothetical protein